MTSELEPSELIAVVCRCKAKMWYRKGFSPGHFGWIRKGEAWYCCTRCAGIEKPDREVRQWNQDPYRYVYGGRKV